MAWGITVMACRGVIIDRFLTNTLVSRELRDYALKARTGDML